MPFGEMVLFKRWIPHRSSYSSLIGVTTTRSHCLHFVGLRSFKVNLKLCLSRLIVQTFEQIFHNHYSDYTLYLVFNLAASSFLVQVHRLYFHGDFKLDFVFCFNELGIASVFLEILQWNVLLFRIWGEIQVNTTWVQGTWKGSFWIAGNTKKWTWKIFNS